MRLAGLLIVLWAVPALAQDEAPAALTDAMARTAADAAEAEARANGWDLTIVVTDAEGVPVHLRRLDGASARSYDIAMRKAATVAATGLSTGEYGRRLEAGDVAEVADGITFAGGVPILRDGELIGAVAASGARAVEDEQASQAGADAVAGN
jgi:glc operon protein GlcG